MADAKISELPAASLPLDGTELVAVVQGGVTKQVARSDLVVADMVKTLSSNQATTSTTATAATALSTTLGAGTYLVKVWVVYQAAATTTGIQMYLRHTGTTTRCAATWYTLTTGTTAATGVADQSTTSTAQVLEGKGQRVSNTANGAMQGVDTANADQFAVLEGIVIVTASGTLDLMFSTEVSGSAVTLMPGTSLVVTKAA